MAAFRGMHVSLCFAGDTKRLWENKQRCRRKIDLNFPFRAVGVRKGIKRRRRVQKERSTTLKRKYAVEEEKYRAKEKVESCDQKDRIDSPMDTTMEQPGPSGAIPSTPRSRTKHILDTEGFNKNKRKLVRKKLLVAHLLLEEVKKNAESRKGRSLSSKMVVSCQVIKKYRFAKHRENAAGIGRKSVCRDGPPKVSKSIRSGFRKVVVDFLQREDNSTILPGKKNTLKAGQVTLQKKYSMTTYTIRTTYLGWRNRITK